MNRYQKCRNISFKFILDYNAPSEKSLTHCTEVRFASFFTGGFTYLHTMAVMNPPEKKLEKRTSVHCAPYNHFLQTW